MEGQKMQPNSRLKYARESRGWSQERVAQAIGTDRITVSRWERGVSVPYPYHREQLRKLFEMDLVALGLVADVQEQTQQTSPEEQQPLPAAASLFDPLIPLQLGSRLIGREMVLHHLCSMLATKRIVGLNGLPGVGKTTLAVALAHEPEIRERFRDGILWAGLGPQPQVLGHLSRWGQLLGLSAVQKNDLRTIEDWGKALRSTIGERRMLLILDDVWRSEDGLALCVGGANCTHVITTRFPTIAIQTAGNDVTQISELSEEDGLNLLARFVPEIVEREAENAHALVKSVGALPLALTLIGKYLHSQAYSAQPRRFYAALKRLQESSERLQLSTPLAPLNPHTTLSTPSSLSLAAVIQVSDAHLEKPAQEMLHALAVFPTKPNTFSEEAAVAVSQQPVEMLDQLCDAGLVESPSIGRYSLHQTIADYAWMQQKEPEEVSARFVHAFVDFLETRDQRASLDQDLSNVLQALEVASSREYTTDLVRGVLAFASSMLHSGLYYLIVPHLQRAHQVVQEMGDVPKRIQLLHHLGWAMQKDTMPFCV